MLCRYAVLGGLAVAAAWIALDTRESIIDAGHRNACMSKAAGYGLSDTDAAYACAVWLGDPLASFYSTEPHGGPIRLAAIPRPDWFRH
jgi:hypothetical protein